MNQLIESQPQTALEIKAQVQRIQQILKDVMLKDVHYGVIPGTHKPTLYKAGAEILLTTFRIAVDPVIDDLSTDDCIRYRVQLRGIANAAIHLGEVSGTVVGVGVGEASTDEEKYKWKSCMEKQFAATEADRKRIKYGWSWGQARGEKVETETMQVRTEPADLANTVLKMAKKRAQVDLCLTALAASDVFDQDLDDLVPGAQPAAHPKAQSTGPQATGESSSKTNGTATEPQLRMLKAKLDDAGVREVDFWAAFEITDWSQLSFDRVNDALSWIKTLAP